MKRFILISVKPEFANKIVAKKKLIELRKNKPKACTGDYVIIYSTKPEMSVIGFAKIERIIESTPREMWENHSNKLGIDRRRFEDYYLNSEKSIGLELSYVCKLKHNISLRSIKMLYPKFSPPQTYKYIPYFSAFRVYKTYLK